MRREGTAYLFSWGDRGHSSVLFVADALQKADEPAAREGTAPRKEAYYVSFYPGDDLQGPIDSAALQSSTRFSSRSYGSSSRSSSSAGFKNGGFKTLSYDTSTTTPFTVHRIDGLNFERMHSAIESARTRTYSLRGSNCADVAESILEAGGLPGLPWQFITLPGTIRDHAIASASAVVTTTAPAETAMVASSEAGTGAGAGAGGERPRALHIKEMSAGVDGDYFGSFRVMSAGGELRVPLGQNDFRLAYADEAIESHTTPLAASSTGSSAYFSPASYARYRSAAIPPAPTPMVVSDTGAGTGLSAKSTALTSAVAAAPAVVPSLASAPLGEGGVTIAGAAAPSPRHHTGSDHVAAVIDLARESAPSAVPADAAPINLAAAEIITSSVPDAAAAARPIDLAAAPATDPAAVSSTFIAEPPL